ncbi:hypothetical protein [Xenorhabdus bovienii]
MPSVNAGGIFVSEFCALTAHINKNAALQKVEPEKSVNGYFCGRLST